MRYGIIGAMPVEIEKIKQNMTIEKEIENMKSYLEIQLCMHDNDFDVIMDIDEEILPYQTLNLLLQPLVENAIDHGIDLKEERLIGAVIVGTGLPMVCVEQEVLRGYFEEKEEAGFDFAYQYPGMNKVLQAAGRVIRTEADRGMILLMDDRFATISYQRLFPREWEQHAYCQVDSLAGQLQEFWLKY